VIPYVGETRSRALRAEATAIGCGLVVVRGRLGKAAVGAWPRWFYDNGAFEDWRAGRAFDAATFELEINALAEGCRAPTSGGLRAPKPDFVVLPDRVGDGGESLGISLDWLGRLGSVLPWALAVQDGGVPEEIPWDAPPSVLFVGGTLAWRRSTAAEWVRSAHAQGRRCHIGRVGSRSRVRWALDIGADSIDSSLPLCSKAHWRRFAGALAGQAQTRWYW
jgi:hypothetical protein